MSKILSFIVNDEKELLLLKGSPNDPQFKKSLWYVVTGGCEEVDKTKEETVKREVKEETVKTENSLTECESSELKEEADDNLENKE